MGVLKRMNGVGNIRYFPTNIWEDGKWASSMRTQQVVLLLLLLLQLKNTTWREKRIHVSSDNNKQTETKEINRNKAETNKCVPNK
mmetsp:Transcript_63447/g.71043  ORF Transcript_63447/g.71043 Transcript_63447/m.71043 type:complete len:85 (-) Transcript_63447:46-300(-)